ncbi:MAG TPA: hypothetical protein VNC18_17595 [Gemmatimonadaceae bacterium]|jgi:hypothetical protein|nr:hypothetical protein [Gemmatimonadaceae bacterium]
MTTLPIDLQLADALVSQAMLNERLVAALASVRDALGAVDEVATELREDVATIATEQARVNARMESLTATVGRLMTLVEPTGGPELHSVKVDE